MLGGILTIDRSMQKPPPPLYQWNEWGKEVKKRKGIFESFLHFYQKKDRSTYILVE
jgi:hypothetical protein|tara:strand:+ start:428 stop:595 length:168 start_codon:yes stop_codon:yes gene_type:complete